jgi:indolepyruvate ferredoxin oxidoreductase beta subunit
MKEFNIVLAGVGGQGTLLAAEILGTAAVKEGLNVRVSELHGMAQRGGAVVSNVRIGENVLAPTVLDGQADVLLGFEPLETLRNLRFASEKTLVIISDERIPPTELAAKMMRYPSMKEIVEKIHRFTENVTIVEAAKLAKEAGNILTQNIVLIGALAAIERMPVKTESVVEALRELVPSKHLDVNVKAFKLGYECVKKGKTKF